MNSIIQPSRLALAAASVVLIAGCSSSAKEMPIAPPTPVHIADVVEGASTLPISTSGRLSPKTQIQLSFKTGGLVDRIYVDEGDRLRRGQLLASLNLAEIDAQVRQARSAYEKAERDASRNAPNQSLAARRASPLDSSHSAFPTDSPAASKLSRCSSSCC